MSGLLQFELRPFDEDCNQLEPQLIEKRSEAAARAHAGRVAKANNGPCDLARAGNADWSDRYITTANPSEFHVSGYRFERLDG